jgi:hypothetical protein
MRIGFRGPAFSLSLPPSLFFSLSSLSFAHSFFATFLRQETEVVETKVTKGPGITVDKAAMGQAPFWVAVIGGMTVLKMVRQKAAGRSVLDNKDDKFIPQNEKVKMYILIVKIQSIPI